jgi:hypothetical protein
MNIEKPDDEGTNNKQEIINNLNNIEFDDIIKNLNIENLHENKNDNITSINPTNANIAIDLNNIYPSIELNQSDGKQRYDTLFRTDTNSSSNSPEKNFIKKTTISALELKNDDNLLKKSLTVQKDEYIKIEDWDILCSTNTINDQLLILESNFKTIDDKSKIKIFIYKVNRGDLYSLYDTIKRCGIYNNNPDAILNVGPVSTLEYMVEQTFGWDKNLSTSMANHVLSLESHIFRWRSIFGDGNCYYRAVIFSFMENIIFEKNILLLKTIITEINEKFDQNYFNTRTLSQSIRNDILSLDKNLIIKVLYIIYEVLENSKDSVLPAYEVLLKSFLYCRSFDLAMIMYFRYKIYEFIKANWNKVYTKEFSVKIGNLLPAMYETDYGGNYNLYINYNIRISL